LAAKGGGIDKNNENHKWLNIESYMGARTEPEGMHDIGTKGLKNIKKTID